MEFKRQGYIVICKEPEQCEGYFASIHDGFLTTEIEDAEIFVSEKSVQEYISEYDDPELYTYKPIEISYRIKNVKLV